MYNFYNLTILRLKLTRFNSIYIDIHFSVEVSLVLLHQI